MASIPPSARALIESGALAHLVTRNADGSPQISCVWVGLDGDELVSGHLGASQRKLANVTRDPRVSLSLEAPEVNEIGMRHYLVVHGRAVFGRQQAVFGVERGQSRIVAGQCREIAVPRRSAA